MSFWPQARDHHEEERGAASAAARRVIIMMVIYFSFVIHLVAYDDLFVIFQEGRAEGFNRSRS